ncbi:MAG: hypothetical protein ACQEQE_02305 [Bacillota bacterium]
MKKNIYKLKNLIYDLEYYIDIKNDKEVLESINEMQEICSKIKKNYMNGIEIDYSKSQPLDYEIINVLDFIYIPFEYKLEDDDIYIEKFFNKRTSDLKNTNTLNPHNEFWSKHETIAGNVYGSIPMELISKKQIESLKNIGWKKVKVEIVDLKNKDLCVKNIKKFCQKNFYRYIIIKEKETSAFLVLNYKMEINGVYK